MVGLCLFASTLHANNRTCRIVYPERPRDAPKMAYLFDGSESQRVMLPSRTLSPVMKLPGGEITLSMSPDSISSPDAVPKGAPSLKIPENVTDFYILITHDPGHKELPIKMELIDLGGGKLKFGETLWYNFTEHRISAKLGDVDVLVDPNKKAVSKAPLAKSGHYKAEITYQVKGEGEFARVTEQRWWHDARSRHLGFIIQSGQRLPKLYLFRDFR